MGIRCQIEKKLSQATCDKIEWNRKILRLRKCLKEVAKEISCDKKKKEKK